MSLSGKSFAKPQKYCQFPECSRTASETFAGAKLCLGHADAIWAETKHFYGNKAESKREAEVRPLYYRIDHLISWSKRSLRRKNGDEV